MKGPTSLFLSTSTRSIELTSSNAVLNRGPFVPSVGVALADSRSYREFAPFAVMSTISMCTEMNTRHTRIQFYVDHQSEESSIRVLDWMYLRLPKL